MIDTTKTLLTGVLKMGMGNLLDYIFTSPHGCQEPIGGVTGSQDKQLVQFIFILHATSGLQPMVIIH